MYKFQFLIKEWDDKDFRKGFTIKKDTNRSYEYARAEAMVEAQIQYLQFKQKWDSKYVFFLYILERKRYGFGEEWVEIKTSEIDRWYDSQIEKLYKDIYG